MHDLTAGTGAPLGGLHVAGPGGVMEESENKHVFDELASQEHIRALETQVSVLSVGIVRFPVHRSGECDI